MPHAVTCGILGVSLSSATSEHPDAGLACDAIKMAATVRGAIDDVIFHTDSRIYLHRNAFHHTVPKDRSIAIDGQGRFVFR